MMIRVIEEAIHCQIINTVRTQKAKNIHPSLVRQNKRKIIRVSAVSIIHVLLYPLIMLFVHFSYLKYTLKRISLIITRASIGERRIAGRGCQKRYALNFPLYI